MNWVKSFTACLEKIPPVFVDNSNNSANGGTPNKTDVDAIVAG